MKNIASFNFKSFTCGVLLLQLSSTIFAANDNQHSVSALGRFEPDGGVIRLAAPSTARSLSGSLLAELYVKEGDNVNKGDLLAVTDSKPLLEVALKQAQSKLAMSIVESQAIENIAEAACIVAKFAKREAERQSTLFTRKLASEEEKDQAQVEDETRAVLCKAAKANSNVADSNISVERNNVEYQKVELERTMIRAPFNSRVLDILVQPGELITPKGLLELGRVDRMFAIAEVYETDIAHVEVGQKAKIISSVLAEPLYGKVDFIHLKVAKKDVIGTDPAALKDARIIEVEILLDKPKAAADLTYLQVQIIIESN
ncbi:MAG: HlyD family secretion protein [Enterobacterales bacterium]|jgi:HlyD family secretion protein